MQDNVDQVKNNSLQIIINIVIEYSSYLLSNIVIIVINVHMQVLANLEINFCAFSVMTANSSMVCKQANVEVVNINCSFEKKENDGIFYILISILNPVSIFF